MSGNITSIESMTGLSSPGSLEKSESILEMKETNSRYAKQNNFKIYLDCLDYPDSSLIYKELRCLTRV